jgi:hypothetical protein
MVGLLRRHARRQRDQALRRRRSNTRRTLTGGSRCVSRHALLQAAHGGAVKQVMAGNGVVFEHQS